MYPEEVAYKSKHHVKSILAFPSTPWVLTSALGTPKCLLTLRASVFIDIGPKLTAI